MIGAEWRIVAREPIVRWVAVILLVLTALSLWNGERFRERRDADARAEITRSLDKRAADEATLAREAADPATAKPFGASEPTKSDWNAARPAGPLAALSFGREDIEPLSANVSLWMTRDDTLFHKYEFASPVALAAGRFDAGFLVVLLLPLFMLALGYNVVAEERESGRLRLAQVQSARIGRRLFARLLLRLVPVYATLPLIAVWSVVHGAPIGRLAAWLLTALVYLLFWTGANALVALIHRRQEVVALIAAGVWLTVVVLLPAAGGAAATLIAPSPLQFELIGTSRQASLDANRKLLENLQGYVSDHPDLMTNPGENDWSAKLYVSQLIIERGIAPVMATQRAAAERQSRWSHVLRFLSPASATDGAMTDIAGAGHARQLAYIDQVRSFLQEWRRRLSPMIFGRVRVTAADVDRLPRFEFREPPAPSFPVAALLGFNAVLAAIALIMGRRAFTRLDRS